MGSYLNICDIHCQERVKLFYSPPIKAEVRPVSKGQIQILVRLGVTPQVLRKIETTKQAHEMIVREIILMTAAVKKAGYTLEARDGYSPSSFLDALVRLKLTPQEFR